MVRRPSALPILSPRHWGRRLCIGGALLLPALLIACTGVTVRNDPATTSGGTGHGYDVAVRVDPPSLQQGQKATINYAFTDRQTHKPTVNLPVVGGVTVHTVVVSHDLKWFHTGQAVGPVGGAYPVNLRFESADSYEMYAEFTSAYTPTEQLVYTHTLSFGTNPAALEEPITLPENTSAARGNVYYGVAVKLDNGSPTGDDQPLVYHVGQSARFHYTLTVGDQPVRELEPFNGALGHLFIISADKEEFAHLRAQEATGGAQGGTTLESGAGGGSGSQSGNPVGQVGMNTPAPGSDTAVPILSPTVDTRGVGTTATVPLVEAGPTAQATFVRPTGFGPELTFEHTFEKPGQYKAWLQFLYHGQVVTADYVVRVAP
ncbi:MAG: hypothetical protein M3Z04_10440 [Chloroflexota bacterium]|nr:hypothetical protein [Chloroflexota bacterium]